MNTDVFGGTLMRSRILLAVLSLFAVFGVASPAYAGSPHFVDGSVVAVADGASLTVSGKEAGLGDELQVHIVVTATAACLNPGQQFPQAGNKESVQAAGDFPVQSGKADFSLTLVASFQPPCSPPMSIVWGDIVVTDTTNGITTTL
jgi:hypothetical protein